MARHVLASVCIGSLLLLGCSDDDTTNKQTDGSVSQTDGSASQTDGAAANDASVETTTISGIVYSVGGDTEEPVAGATVTLRDSSPLVQTTSASDGSYAMQLPIGQPVVLEVTQDSLLTSLLKGIVPSSGITDAHMSMLRPDAADYILSALGSVERDTAKGIVVVEFEMDGSASGTETVTISAESGGSFVFDASDEPELGNTLKANSDTTVVFFNVTPADTTVTISNSDCELTLPAGSTYPVEANAVTWVSVNCPE